jgi:hypothetical protein
MKVTGLTPETDRMPIDERIKNELPDQKIRLSALARRLSEYESSYLFYLPLVSVDHPAGIGGVGELFAHVSPSNETPPRRRRKALHGLGLKLESKRR